MGGLSSGFGPWMLIVPVIVADLSLNNLPTFHFATCEKINADTYVECPLPLKHTQEKATTYWYHKSHSPLFHKVNRVTTIQTLRNVSDRLSWVFWRVNPNYKTHELKNRLPTEKSPNITFFFEILVEKKSHKPLLKSIFEVSGIGTRNNQWNGPSLCVSFDHTHTP